ncbi:hypothetical protein EK21DRAFT_76272 [Setomelanomma holmii]|uniref:Uncharacterized protein n=1 Tax=Setomelanomma holmii TaxID=210430 RepID=A0A9P4LHS8_9PLEO|nr:hypothetical protein EK21DRAFT_76272 [Setomelanomma holmii]
MPDFNEARTPLTSESVQTWSRANFSASFRALPGPKKLKWHSLDKFDLSNRTVYRSLGRSAHKQLLVIGGYAPGSEVEDEQDDVLAHLHHDAADVSFYRAQESENGRQQELHQVTSTATVAFHEPFCHVGDDAGGSKAIHRVSALIQYYFLAAGHVKELVRTRGDPTMFTRNFKDACAWIENEGEKPDVPPTRRISGFMTSPPLPGVPVRPKRSSTMSSLSQSTTAEEAPTPPLTRSATDSISTKIKREREEEIQARPKKHPRRTLSEQIVIPGKLLDPTFSPRSPIPHSPYHQERVHKAMTERVISLKKENTNLKDINTSLEDNRDEWRQRATVASADIEQMKKEMSMLVAKVSRMENELGTVRGRLDKCEKKSKG